MSYKKWYRVRWDKDMQCVNNYEEHKVGIEDYNGHLGWYMSFLVEWEENDEGEVKVIGVEGFNS